MEQLFSTLLAMVGWLAALRREAKGCLLLLSPMI
jgi:hypothetical protein